MLYQPVISWESVVYSAWFNKSKLAKEEFNSMDISELSSEYEVRKLTEDDGDRISEKRN